MTTPDVIWDNIDERNQQSAVMTWLNNQPKDAPERNKRKHICKSNIDSFKHALSTASWADLLMACKGLGLTLTLTLFLQQVGETC